MINYICIIFNRTANGFSAGDSGTTTRHDTQKHKYHTNYHNTLKQNTAHKATQMMHAVSLFQAILLTLTILSATSLEIAVSFPTYFPVGDNSFPEAKQETQFSTESQNTKEIPHAGDVDETKRNLSLGDGFDANSLHNATAPNYYRENRVPDQGYGVFTFFQPIGAFRSEGFLNPWNCGDLNITCIIIFT
jgi:hypothetical protein